MAVTCQERNNSRDVTIGENDAATLRYVIRGAGDDLAAYNALLANSPATHQNMPRLNLSVEPQGGGNDIWYGTVRYGWPSVKDVGENRFTFDTGGGTQHITQSLATTSYGTAPPDFNGAIGVTKDSVNGVDIIVPQYNFSETYYFAETYVTDSYKSTIADLTGKINDATFRTFAAGEVLFRGASGSQRGNGDWEITFKFSQSPNVTAMTIGSIAGIAKDGWQYLWVRYQDVEDTAAKAVVKRPLAVYVEDVYESGDFAGLGIGT